METDRRLVDTREPYQLEMPNGGQAALLESCLGCEENGSKCVGWWAGRDGPCPIRGAE